MCYFEKITGMKFSFTKLMKNVKKMSYDQGGGNSGTGLKNDEQKEDSGGGVQLQVGWFIL